MNEERLLLQFDPARPLPESFTILRKDGLVKVTGLAGVEYVIRFAADHADTRFEKFAADFAGAAPETSVTGIRLLDPKETKQLIRTLRDKDSAGFSQLRFDRDLNIQASVAVYYPGMTLGTEYLAHAGVTESLREELLNAVSTPLLASSPRTLASIQKRIDMLWLKMGEEQQRIFATDWASLHPEARAIPLERFQTYLAQNLIGFSKSSVERMIVLGLERLPPPVRTQLADHWSLYLALGIPDFHANNWLIYHGQILGIDLALPSSEAFFKGQATLDFAKQHPFGDYKLPSFLRIKMLRSLSPAMKSYLAQLTPELIRDLAKKSGYSIKDHQIQGILQRAKLVLKEAS